ALLKDTAILRDHAAVFPAQTLGGVLNRGERVLDFMGDAPCDIGSGRGALRGNDLRYVVKRHHVPARGCTGLLAGHPHREMALSTIAVDCHLTLKEPLDTGARRRKRA